MSVQDQMEALREALNALTKEKLKPEEFPPGLLARAGIAAKDCKVKAIEKKIQELRSVVSKSTKQETKDDLEKEAQALGISVDELTGKVKKNKDPDHKQDHEELKKGRQSEREKKQMNAAVARGDFDLTAHPGEAQDD
jgi:hypothetical protein